MIKEIVSNEEIQKFKKEVIIFGVVLFAWIVSAPFLFQIGTTGMICWAILSGLCIILSLYIEKQKRKYNIATYKEIYDFMEGKRLDEIETAKEQARNRTQTFLFVIASMVIAFMVTYVIMSLIS